MTEFQLELLYLLYYALMAGVLFVKICFLILICAMLIEYIISLLKGFRERIKK